MNIQEIMDTLVAEGYQDCTFDTGNPNQIIVNSRGEIELAYGEAKIYDRLANTPGFSYGNHEAHSNIKSLMLDVKKTWKRTK